MTASREPVSGGASLARLADPAGLCVSVGCVFHCLALPVLAASAPGVLRGPLESEWIPGLAIACAGPLAVLGIGSGLRRHRHIGIALAAAPGLLLLGVGLFGAGTRAQEMLLTVAGAALVGGAHLANLRARRSSP